MKLQFERKMEEMKLQFERKMEEIKSQLEEEMKSQLQKKQEEIRQASPPEKAFSSGSGSFQIQNCFSAGLF